MPVEAVKFQKLVESLAEMPADAPKTYVYLWQLETWLRQMVYVELKSEMGGHWTDAVQSATADRYKESDSLLTHIPGPETQVLSFLSLGNLAKVIDRRWDLFKRYLPPKDIWSARLWEVEHVRNRIAHFRYGNTGDNARVAALLRDIDHGMWRFCTSYNDLRPVLPPELDPIAERVAYHEGGTPWVMIGDDEQDGWALLTAPRKMGRLSVQLEVSQRSWVEPQQPPYIDSRGFIYSLSFNTADNNIFDYARLIDATAWCEPIVLHMILDGLMTTVRYTLPAVSGSGTLITAIDRLVKDALSCVRPQPYHNRKLDFASLDLSYLDNIQKFANSYPEYILGPRNPLAFLYPEMSGPFFLL